MIHVLLTPNCCGHPDSFATAFVGPDDLDWRAIVNEVEAQLRERWMDDEDWRAQVWSSWGEREVAEAIREVASARGVTLQPLTIVAAKPRFEGETDLAVTVTS